MKAILKHVSPFLQNHCLKLANVLEVFSLLQKISSLLTRKYSVIDIHGTILTKWNLNFLWKKQTYSLLEHSFT